MSLHLKTVCFAWHVHCCQSRLKLSILGAFHNFCLISRQLCVFSSFRKNGFTFLKRCVLA